MAVQKNIISVVALVLACVMVAVHASPVPDNTEVVAAEATSSSMDSDSMRDGRFYGLGGSQASAIASASAVGGGYGGYPYGGGLGIASATAAAQAGGMGYPYGK